MIWLPKIGIEQAEVISLLEQSESWKETVKYLEECLEYVVTKLGDTDNTRDDDMALKGEKAVLEHIIDLPRLSKKRLNPPPQEEEIEPLDERVSRSTKEEGGS